MNIPKKYKPELQKNLISFRASDSLKAKLEKYAKKEGVARSIIIVWALETLFEELENAINNTP
jgi:predicted transcriptional regulator